MPDQDLAQRSARWGQRAESRAQPGAAGFASSSGEQCLDPRPACSSQPSLQLTGQSRPIAGQDPDRQSQGLLNENDIPILGDKIVIGEDRGNVCRAQFRRELIVIAEQRLEFVEAVGFCKMPWQVLEEIAVIRSVRPLSVTG